MAGNYLQREWKIKKEEQGFQRNVGYEGLSCLQKMLYRFESSAEKIVQND